MDISSRAKLNSSLNIPYLGLGVWRNYLKNAYRSICWALEAGYRHIDTARIYFNETNVGKAIRDSYVDRNDVFITTKLWLWDCGYENAIRACENSLIRLNVDYVDLYLIYWPHKYEKKRVESWHALEKLHEDGKCKSIGVSNYSIINLQEVQRISNVKPAVNQVEFSPYYNNNDLIMYCKNNNIQIVAYSPLTRGKYLEESELTTLAKRYGKSTAQILIRWCLQNKIVTIPKSSKRERIIENSQVFDFMISEKDMNLLNSFNLKKNGRVK